MGFVEQYFLEKAIYPFSAGRRRELNSTIISVQCNMMNVCSLILMMVLSQMQSSEAKGFENVLEEHKLRIIAILLYNFTVLFKGGNQMLIFVFSFNYLM